MDFKERIMQTYSPLPFFMAYPGYSGRISDTAVIQDLEYLQQTYPNTVKKYQRRIAEILDKLDYDGSMIYDEYPDKMSIQRLANSMINIFKNEENEIGEKKDDNEWARLNDIVQILLCNEIYKRRHGGRRGKIL